MDMGEGPRGPRRQREGGRARPLRHRGAAVVRQVVLGHGDDGPGAGAGAQDHRDRRRRTGTARLTERRLHYYLQPDREIDDGALEVHGITREFLRDKPRFAEVHADILSFVLRRRGHHPQRAVRRCVSRQRAWRGSATRTSSWRTTAGSSTASHWRGQLHPGAAQQPRCAVQALRDRQFGHASFTAPSSTRRFLADVYLAMTGGQAVLALGGAGGETAAAILLARRGRGSGGPARSRWCLRAGRSSKRTPASLPASTRRAAGSACGSGANDGCVAPRARHYNRNTVESRPSPPGGPGSGGTEFGDDKTCDGGAYESIGQHYRNHRQRRHPGVAPGRSVLIPCGRRCG